jgi:hypothetical protein
MNVLKFWFNRFFARWYELTEIDTPSGINLDAHGNVIADFDKLEQDLLAAEGASMTDIPDIIPSADELYINPGLTIKDLQGLNDLIEQTQTIAAPYSREYNILSVSTPNPDASCDPLYRGISKDGEYPPGEAVVWTKTTMNEDSSHNAVLDPTGEGGDDKVIMMPRRCTSVVYVDFQKKQLTDSGILDAPNFLPEKDDDPS